MRGIGLAAAFAVVVLIAAGVVAAVFLRSPSRGGGRARFRASEAELAFIGPKIPVVDALARSLAPGCVARRGRPDEPSPAVRTPITAWPETLSVRTECMYESPPGSGNASGGGYAQHGTAPSLNGAWHAFGPRGYVIGRCQIIGREDCAGFSVFGPDPSHMQIDAFRRFPTDDGWAHVEVMLRRPP